MSKDKKNEGNPHGLGSASTLPADYGRANSQLENGTPSAVSGDGPPISGIVNSGPSQLKGPPIKKAWSSPIQAMARIEQEMNGLSEFQQKIVFNWFAATYCPAGSSVAVITDPQP